MVFQNAVLYNVGKIVVLCREDCCIYLFIQKSWTKLLFCIEIPVLSRNVLIFAFAFSQFVWILQRV